MKKLIAYLRCSTSKKNQVGPEQNGYSFDAQMASIKGYAASIGGEIVATYSEQRSGGDNARPGLLSAFSHAKQLNSSGEEAIVVVAKLDRLSRDASMVIQMSNAGAPFRIAEMPNADHLQLSLLAILAEQERKTIRSRVKSGMLAAKLKGRVFGSKNPALSVKLMNEGARKKAQIFRSQMLPIIDEIRTKGKISTLAGIAACLNARGIKSRTNGIFYPTTIRNLLASSV